MLELRGRYTDEDADDAVVERGEVGNAVKRVGEKADNYSGERTAYHGGEDGADGVSENRDLEKER